MKSINTKRNGVIDLYRFLFAVMICFHHARYLGGGAPNAIMHGSGHMAVEFFFFVSGYFMAASIKKSIEVNSGISLGKETQQFVFRKIKAILPYYSLAVIASFIGRFFIEKLTLNQQVQSIFDACLLRMTGIKSHTVVHATWYLSAMFISMLLLYPLARKFKDTFSHVIAPLACMLLFGYLSQKYGNLDLYNTNFTFCYSGLLRSVADISLGCIIFEVASWLKGFKYTMFARIVISIANVVLLVLVFVATNRIEQSNTDYVIMLLIAVLTTFAFAKIGVLSNLKLFYSGFFTFLGKMSLVLYLNHFLVKSVLAYYFKSVGYWDLIKIYVPAVIAVSFAMMLIKFVLGKCFSAFPNGISSLIVKGKKES